MILFLIGIAIGESLRIEEQRTATKEENNGRRNTYRSGYIPSRNNRTAHQRNRSEPAAAPHQQTTHRR
jgi:hypothetical protein